VWNHKAVSTNLLAFQYNPETLEEYRIKFPALCTIHPYLIELIDRHHGNISPAIYHEERLNLADLGILSDAEIEDSLHFMQRLIKTHQTVIGEIADDIATWVTCMTKRYTKEAWQRKERVALWLSVNARDLKEGEKLELPPKLDLCQTEWLLDAQKIPKTLVLRQLNGDLWMEIGNNPQTPTSPLAEIEVTGHVYFKPINSEESPYLILYDATNSILLPTPASPRFSIRTCREELEIETLFKPPSWANLAGLDKHGFWAAFQLGNVEQVMRWIAPGEFMMGSPKEEINRNDDELLRPVVFSKGFWLADTACTQQLWEMVMGDNPSIVKADTYPVDWVSWEQVKVFLEKLNERMSDHEFRLPTEAEWEYACRAGTSTPFSFGNTITSSQVHFDRYFPYDGSVEGRYWWEFIPVKALPCNSWGLYQMHGNVWEWCDDWYGEYTEDITVDPKGPENSEHRVLRGGGGLQSYSRGIRSACRLHRDPAERIPFAGFRLARSGTE